MTAITSTILTLLLCGGFYWYYYGPSIITRVTLEIVTDTRDGNLHSLNFLKEDVDHKFVQDRASILARLYFSFKHPHGRYVIMEEVLYHILDQNFLSTAFAGVDIVIFIEPTNGESVDSITPIMWKSVGLQGTKFVVVNQRDGKGDPLHWQLYSVDGNDDEIEVEGEAGGRGEADEDEL